ncbi:MAG TPA: condensation domain-containing protein, partial [Allocoleopsis sp.]
MKKAESHALVPTLEEYLEHYLQNYLPQYMLPTHYIPLEQLPLTAAGKLDVNALPKVQRIQHEYVAPSTELEKELCQQWQELLEVTRVGITDDFFRLGGNSILAIQFTHRVMQRFQIHLAVADVFQHKTIAQLTKVMEQAHNIVIPVSHAEHPVLSFAQQRLWFIEQYEQGTTAYHNPMFFELAANLDQGALQQALKAIVARHEILRTVLREDSSGEVYQEVLRKELPIQMDYLDNELSYQERLAEGINRVFDLTTDYPIRVCFYTLKQTKQTFLLINIHHIAFDGWSVDKLFYELNAYYQHYHQGKTVDLAPLSIQYKDYAQWQRDYLQGEVLNQQIQYWTNKLSNY